MFSSSIPDRIPNSDSTDTSRACAYRTMFAVAFIFSDKSRLLKSNMTLEKPMFIACMHDSTDVPWSKCRAICSVGVIFAPAIIPINMSSPMYFNADSEIAIITGDLVRRAADIIAEIVSMLYALNAGTANRLLIALRNISCVLHRPNSEYFMPSPQMYMNMIAK